MKKIFNISSNIIVCGNSSFFTNVNAGPLCDININCMNRIFNINSSYKDFFCKTRCLNESYYNNTCPEFLLESEEIIMIYMILLMILKYIIPFLMKLIIAFY